MAATSPWSRVYFITFYCTASVMVRTDFLSLPPPLAYHFSDYHCFAFRRRCFEQVLNLVVAFILEAFFEKEMEQETAQVPVEGGASTPHQLTRSAVSDHLDGNIGGSQEFSLNSNPHFVTLEETL